MGLIQVIKVGLETELIDQLCTAHAEEDELGDLGRYIGIVQSVSDRLGYIVVLRKIGAQQK